MSEVEKIDDAEVADIELTEEQLDAILDELDNEGRQEDIEDELFDSRYIYLQDDITLETVSDIVKQIHYYNILDDKAEIRVENRKPITLMVNSPGGELHNGFVLLSAIESSATPVHTVCAGGVGMSMGLIVFLSGHVRKLSRHSQLLYHELRANSEVQTLAEMKNIVRHYDQLQNRIDEYIVKRTKVTMKRLKNQRKKNLDWFLTFEECEQYGFFDIEI